ncbi:MAG TPA: alcohol dehydrogenase catalytic domain-containing protein [Streptosporangiaceae bacterium]|nr:alcohol dehydrogenase catalytic domain-containing protein [Streptosporangiaceae bacterium]
MKALVFTAPGTVELLDVPEPDPAPGDVLVQVRAAGICGSELHGARRPGFRKPPLIMGHEFAGVSAEGTAVVINPILSCGCCAECQRGLRHVCRNREIIGVHRAGGFAERVAVPASALRPVPPGLSWEAAALIEPAANAVHAWNQAGGALGASGAKGARVAVIGCGAIGLLCAAMALSGGAGRVDVTDLSPARLAAAQRLGAGAAGPSLAGEYDAVIDAVGSAATRAASVAHQRPGGVAIWLGLAGEEAGFDANALVRSEKRVLGSFAYRDEEFAHAMALIRDWDLTWAAGYPLAAGAEIFTGLMNGGLHPVKALLRP